ncbi:MAG: phosphoglycerate dehydrogenase [Planctomycetota bacterium]
MFNVLCRDNLSVAGIKLLQDTPGLNVIVNNEKSDKLGAAGIRELLREVDGVIIRSDTKMTPEILKDQPRLKIIVRAGVGVDNIDLDAATRAGIVVMNTPAGNTTSTAEHAVTMMMAMSRYIAPADASIKAGKWDKKSFTGTQLAGKTLAVIGLGRIGQSVARRAIGLEMKVVGYDPFLSVEKAAEQGITLYRDIDELLPLCDYLTVHTPGGAETKGLIGKERIAKMRKGVRLINCARGGIIDETALADALDAGHVAGAALDVFEIEPLPADSRLLKTKNLLTTPHLGASTEEAQESVATEAAEIISGFLIRNEVRHAVNMAPITSSEMADMKAYLDLGRRLGLLLAQQNKSTGVKSAVVNYRGEAATKKTKLITNAFACGLLESALDESVNIVNAELLARERGIEITETTSTEPSDFHTMVQAIVQTDHGELTASATIFGKQFLRLVRLGKFSIDAYLDGTMLIYRHRDVPGLIGYIGQICGRHQVNIAHMALGRLQDSPGGDSVAILNLDNAPSDEVIEEIKKHPEVTGVEVVNLPKAGAPLPWLVTK